MYPFPPRPLQTGRDNRGTPRLRAQRQLQALSVWEPGAWQHGRGCPEHARGQKGPSEALGESFLPLPAAGGSRVSGLMVSHSTLCFFLHVSPFLSLVQTLVIGFRATQVILDKLSISKPLMHLMSNKILFTCLRTKM